MIQWIVQANQIWGWVIVTVIRCVTIHRGERSETTRRADAAVAALSSKTLESMCDEEMEDNVIDPLKHYVVNGTVTHTRYHPVFNTFQYNLYMTLLSLSALEQHSDHGMHRFVFKSNPNSNIPSICTFNHKHHSALTSSSYETTPISYKQCIYTLIEQHLGIHCNRGEIMLLTHVSTFGIVFNPISIYYVFNTPPNQNQLQFIVAEVSNIPWFQQHIYILNYSNSTQHDHPKHPKQFHVSPFAPIQNVTYAWNISNPIVSSIFIKTCLYSNDIDAIYTPNGHDNREYSTNQEQKELVLFLSAVLKSTCVVEMSSASLMQNVLMNPLITARIMLGIHYEAIKLYFKKGITFYPHPDECQTQLSKCIETVVHLTSSITHYFTRIIQ
uniref:Uncharacterized protein n=1 Tax=Timspurckia oligopyrenoides TaxID=708627 RepID=A0A7S0ZDH4_9RHOD|mmetsp:Transcript_13589/g.24367  ORF Transcript_13589/g.24367 Transcript_13589/m.24367 type:complete len:384 (+) Transcript_13589:63-1214(+)